MNSRVPPVPSSSRYLANMEGVAAVERALTIVEALEKTRKPQSLSQLALATGLYKSAVLRMMVSLERFGLVIRRRDQAYVLGPFALRLGRAYEDAIQLDECLLPLMQEIVDQGLESPSFHVLKDEATRLCVLRIDSHHETLDRVRVGDLLPLDRGAAGKVLRCFESRASSTTALDFLQVSLGERTPSCAAIAGPVFGADGTLLGALSLSGPLERFTNDAIAKMRPVLIGTCQRATAEFGGLWPVHAEVELGLRPSL